MKLTSLLTPECIRIPLQSSDKQGAIFELADLLVEQTDVEDPEDLKAAIWKRETTRTTGIGGGIAVPHGKTDGVDSLRMAIGRAREPLDFGSIDGKPVELIILLASPIDQTGPHITALSKISQILIDVAVRSEMKRCESGEQMYELIKRLESSSA